MAKAAQIKVISLFLGVGSSSLYLTQVCSEQYSRLSCPVLGRQTGALLICSPINQTAAEGKNRAANQSRALLDRLQLKPHERPDFQERCSTVTLVWHAVAHINIAIQLKWSPLNRNMHLGLVLEPRTGSYPELDLFF